MKKAIIVDDERAAIFKLKGLLDDLGAVDVCETFISPMEALEYAKSNHIDVAFVDIEMPNINGIELADRFIDINEKVNIVFVTAYSEFAVEAFRINALDYLLKPIKAERLKDTIERLPKTDTTEKKSSSIKVDCFGKFQVKINNELIKFRTAKAEELFAYLVTSKGVPVNRNNIMDLFWEDYDGDRALILFNTTLHYLKKAFINNGKKLNIKFDRGTYRLDMADINCDIMEFESFFTKIKEVNNENIDEALKIIKLYSGNYMEHNDYDWTLQKQTELKQMFSGLVLKICDYYKNENMKSEIIALIQNALVYDPLDKYLNLKLIETYYLKNDKVSMKKQYDIYKNRLNLEYGIEPGREYREIMSKI